MPRGEQIDTETGERDTRRVAAIPRTFSVAIGLMMSTAALLGGSGLQRSSTAFASLPSPAITTQVTPPAIAVGASVRATATLAPPGAGAPIPTGSVTFDYYPPGDPNCTGHPLLSSIDPLGRTGAAASSVAFTPSAAGTYRVTATYGGDSAYDAGRSACGDPHAAVVVARAPTTISAAASAPTVVLGLGFGATATLGTHPPGGAAPTGSVTFDVYGPDDATCRGPAVSSTTGSIDTAGTTAASGNYTPTSTGSYRVIASYSGDANHAGASSSCGDPADVAVVSKLILGITAAVAPASIRAGGSFEDSAALTTAPSNLPRPTGTVSFDVFASSDANCTGAPIVGSVVPLDAAGATATSGPLTPVGLGPHRVVATYSGDLLFGGSATPCGAEAQVLEVYPLTIAASQSRPTTIPPRKTAPKAVGTPPRAARPKVAAAAAAQPVAPPAGTPARPRTSQHPRPPTAQKTTPAATRAATPSVASTSDRYDPRSDPKRVVGLEVALFTLLALAGGRGLALAGLGTGAQEPGPPAERSGGAGGGGDGSGGGAGGGGAGGGSGGGGGGAGGGGAGGGSGGGGGGAGGGGGGGGGASFDVDYEGLEIVGLGVAAGAAGGDRSGTWRWPGTAALDAAGVRLPANLVRRSPLLARIVADGAYLRSILGSIAIVGPLLGVVLGLVAIDQAGGRALPPSTTLTIGIAALGVIDAAAGLAAVLTFVFGVAVSGGLDSNAALRTMLGLGALWFAIPVIAGAARPLRREPPRSRREFVERAEDFVIASLIGAWAVQKLVIALPGLSGHKLAIGSQADEVALWLLFALVVRMLGEQVASHFYPGRLAAVQPRELREPGRVQRVWAAVLRTGIFLFVAVVVAGSTWQLWTAGVLFLIPQVLAVFEGRFRKSAALGRLLPEGLVEVLIMLFLLTGLGALLLSTHAKSLIADSFVLLALPGAALAILHLFAGERTHDVEGAADDAAGATTARRWWAVQTAGAALLGGGVLQVLGVLF